MGHLGRARKQTFYAHALEHILHLILGIQDKIDSLLYYAVPALYIPYQLLLLCRHQCINFTSGQHRALYSSFIFLHTQCNAQPRVNSSGFGSGSLNYYTIFLRKYYDSKYNSKWDQQYN